MARRRRRSRARENPSTGFWIAVGVGVVAVGGVAYVMTRPSTAAAATTPPPTHPTNDAATFQPASAAPLLTPAQSAAISASLNQSIAAGTIPGGVALSFSVNGHSVNEQYVPNQANLANDVHQAVFLASIGHGAGKEGEGWVARAKVDGAGVNELAQLRSAGYAV